jgi:hypothetical protein
MDAIDWPALARGALWVLGISISLAALSHVRWAAKRDGVRLRKALSWDSFLAPFCAGLALFAAGMAWGATRLWETIAWSVLALLFIVQAVLAWRSRSKPGEGAEGGETAGDVKEERT